ncbi:fimbrial protein [Siccibacter turicensis]|uniref:fimbrial protein n=1 Tax=Siccibacter turicensis TaxID=357233 RepID=UPI002A6B5BEB|nr:fimbrial protein [Siccibacter turicensis]MDY0972477.1 fimbrial protein [Siccibacter turicensis]
MKMKLCLLCALMNMALIHGVSAAEDNVHFSGALVSEPCTLPDADADITLDFGSIIMKSLYKYQRTMSKPFEIHLQDCDPSLMQTVSVTFQGTADAELTDMLAIDASSTATGVAIGLELADGSAFGINKTSPWMQINQGSNILAFKAYVQIKPSSASGGKLAMGNFTSTSTFVLSYQ